MKLSEIAKIIGVDFNGEEREISSMSTLKDADATQLSFVSNSKYIKDIQESHAGAIICDSATQDAVPSGATALVVDNPYWKMAVISAYFAPALEDIDSPKAVVGEGSVISPNATLANGAIVGKNTQIMAGVYVGSNVEIGDNVTLYPNVVIYRDCKIGNSVTIHANSTIGSDGFGFATNQLGEHKKIYQNGNVILEDDIEIGSSTTIDRAVFKSTLLKKGVRIDNLVQIGHNCEIGEYSVFVAQSGSAGSTKLGRNVVVGGQAAFAGHLEVAAFSTFAARSGVTKTIKESGKTFAGFPLMDHRVWLKLQVKLARLIK